MIPMTANGPTKRYKIGEVCKKADVQPYVLRYWETEFPPLSPGKSGGGQRLYTDCEVEIILRIKDLLYSEGFTIAGAKKRLDSELATGALGQSSTESDEPKRQSGSGDGSGIRRVLDETRRELKSILDLLDQ